MFTEDVRGSLFLGYSWQLEKSAGVKPGLLLTPSFTAAVTAVKEAREKRLEGWKAGRGALGSAGCWEERKKCRKVQDMKSSDPAGVYGVEENCLGEGMKAISSGMNIILGRDRLRQGVWSTSDFKCLSLCDGL